MEALGLKAKASECRLLAVGSQGEHSEQLLTLADEYDSIHDALMRLKAEQECTSDDQAVAQIAQWQEPDV